VEYRYFEAEIFVSTQIFVKKVFVKIFVAHRYLWKRYLWRYLWHTDNLRQRYFETDIWGRDICGTDIGEKCLKAEIFVEEILVKVTSRKDTLTSTNQESKRDQRDQRDG
jgi:hypothetical protein